MKDNKEKKSLFSSFPFSMKADLSCFELATDDEKRQQERMRESSSFLRDGFKRLVKNPISLICIIVVTIITLIAFIAPLVYPYEYETTSAGGAYTTSYQAPFTYSTRESILNYSSDDVVLLGWSKANEETVQDENYGGLRVIDSKEYLDEVKQYFVTDGITFEDSGVVIYAVWGVDKNHDGVADYGADFFPTTQKQDSLVARTTITYHINGGEGTTPVDSTDYISSDRVSPIHEDLDFSRTGYVFVGWSTIQDVPELTLSNFDEVMASVIGQTKMAKSLDLYAVWAADANGDKVPDVEDAGKEISISYSKSKTTNYTLKYDLNMGEGDAPVASRKYVRGDVVYPEIASSVNIIKMHQDIFPHIFGTDQFGRDYAIRVIVGTRVSLLVGIVAALMVVIIGVIYGAISGYFGGRVDMFMMRIVDIIYSLPDTLIIILFSVSLGDSIKNSSFASTADKLGGVGMVSILIVFAMLYWVGMARLVRGQVLSLRQQEYVLAARSMGASPMRIIFKHMLPNCLSVIFISAALQIPSAIFTESTLSFLGVGVSEPMPSLGSLASSGRAYMSIASQRYLFLIPSIVIFLVVLSLNLLGQGLRDAFDPKLRVRGGK